MGTKSVRAGMYAVPAAQWPSSAPTWGTTPESTTCSRNNAPAPANVEPDVDWMRAPPLSSRYTRGMRSRSTSSRMRAVFCSPTPPIDPAMTVKSYAMIATRRPPTLPIPVTTPSAASEPRAASDGSMWSASWPYSTNDPLSRRMSSRSRTGNLPSSRCRATRSGPPMPSAVSLRSPTSSTSGFQLWRSSAMARSYSHVEIDRRGCAVPGRPRRVQ